MPAVSQEQQSHADPAQLRLMERSVFSDRMVFVRAVHEAQWMSDLELSVYDSWFSPIVSALPTIVPDGFIYLKSTPETCMRRLLQRSRAEESKVLSQHSTTVASLGLARNTISTVICGDTAALPGSGLCRTLPSIVTAQVFVAQISEDYLWGLHRKHEEWLADPMMAVRLPYRPNR